MSNEYVEIRERLARIEALLKQLRIFAIIVLLVAFGPYALALLASILAWAGGVAPAALLFPAAVIACFVLLLLFKGKPEP